MIQSLILTEIYFPLTLLVLAFVARGKKNVNLLVQFGKGLLIIETFFSVYALLILLTISEIDHLSFGVEFMEFPFRLDALSLTMFSMVSLIGLIVIQFSQKYLAGESGQDVFMKRIIIAVASIQLFVISGDLIVLLIAWIVASNALQSLIGFHTNRIQSAQAVRSRIWSARLSEVFLLVATILFVVEHNTTSLDTIFAKLTQDSVILTSYDIAASICIAFSATLMAAQLPLHGWLLRVVEAPTPVSALLHAGLLNAGPYLIIRFSYLIDLSLVASILLIFIGGVSALFGTLVFPSQTAVKTKLVYSSIGHMGFSLFLCGLGLYAAAFLHLLAHSFYKAHAFLSSGSTVDNVRLSHLNGKTIMKPGILNLTLGLSLIVGLYMGVNYLHVNLLQSDIRMEVLTLIIFLGITTYAFRSLSMGISLMMFFRVLGVSVSLIVIFLLLESGMNLLIAEQIPNVSQGMQDAMYILVMIYLVAFGLIALTRIFSTTTTTVFAENWKVHKRNGFYIHHVVENILLNSRGFRK